MANMTPTILRNFFGKKATRMYPIEVREPFENSRGELVNDIDKCIFCGACALKCPSQCITVDKDTAVWTCDPYACVYCGVCVAACPTQCLSQKTTYRPATITKVMISQKGVIKERPKKKAKAAEGEA